MTHTAELHTPITQIEYHETIKRPECKVEKDKINHIRSLSQYGITDISPRIIAKSGFLYYYCTVKINLQRLVNGGKRTVKTFSDEGDFEKLRRSFSKFMKEIMPSHRSIDGWTVARLDFNIDIRLTQREVEQYIKLLQKGDKAFSWKIHETEREKKKRKQSKHGQRKTRQPEGSVLFDNKSYSVNIYNKYLERVKEQERRGITDHEELKEAKGILRIELQAKKDKLNALKSKHKMDMAGKPLKAFARYDLAEPVIMDSLKAIAGEADYCTLKIAEKRILSSKATEKTKSNMISFLQSVVFRRSVWNAKKHYKGSMNPKSIIKHLQALNINPVTVPKSFGINEMQNLFHRVSIQFAEEKAAQKVRNGN